MKINFIVRETDRETETSLETAVKIDFRGSREGSDAAIFLLVHRRQCRFPWITNCFDPSIELDRPRDAQSEREIEKNVSSNVKRDRQQVLIGIIIFLFPVCFFLSFAPHYSVGDEKEKRQKRRRRREKREKKKKRLCIISSAMCSSVKDLWFLHSTPLD